MTWGDYCRLVTTLTIILGTMGKEVGPLMAVIGLQTYCIGRDLGCNTFADLLKLDLQTQLTPYSVKQVEGLKEELAKARIVVPED